LAIVAAKLSTQWLFAFHFPEIIMITFKLILKSDWLFCFTVPFSLTEKKTRFRAKNGAIREYIAPLTANQFAKITSDFKMDLINN